MKWLFLILLLTSCNTSNKEIKLDEARILVDEASGKRYAVIREDFNVYRLMPVAEKQTAEK